MAIWQLFPWLYIGFLSTSGWTGWDKLVEVHTKYVECKLQRELE